MDGKITRRQAIGTAITVAPTASLAAAAEAAHDAEFVWTFGTAVAAAPLPVAAIKTIVCELPGPFTLCVAPSSAGAMTAVGAQSLLRQLGRGWSIIYSDSAGRYTFLRETNGR
jgi:hypothetical protein